MKRFIAPALAAWLALFAAAAPADSSTTITIEAEGPIKVNGLEVAPEGSMTTIGIEISIQSATPPPPEPSGPAPLRSYDATVVESVTLDGSVVVQWDDLSGNEGHAIKPASPPAGPTYTTGVSINPVNSVFLNIAGPNAGTEHEFFLVAKCPAGSNLCYPLFASGSEFVRLFGNTLTYQFGWSQTWVVSDIQDDEWHLLRFRRDGDDVTLYLDGATVSTKTNASMTAADFTAAGHIVHGVSGAYGIGAIRIYEGTLSDEDAATVTEEMATQFGITLPE